MFWLILFLVLTLLPIAVGFVLGRGWRWVALWELVLFSPVIIFFLLVFLKPIKVVNRDLYIPKVGRDFYLLRGHWK